MKKMKNLVCLVLALAMCLGLAACGSGSSGSGSGSTASSAPSAGGSKSAAATPAPEFVYASSFDSLIKDSKDYFAVRAYGDDGIFLSSYEKVGERIPEGAKVEYEGQYDVFETFLYRLDKNGKLTKLDKYRSVAAPEDDQNRKNYNSGSDLMGICLTPDGFVTVEVVYTSWNDGEGNIVMYSDEYWQSQRFQQDYYIRSFDRDGNELTCAPIEVSQEDGLNAYNMQLDEKGNVVVPIGQGVRAIDLEGKDVYIVPTSGYIDSLIKLPDGRIAATIYDDQQLLCILDAENSKFVDGVPINFDLYNAVAGGGEYDIYYTNGAYFYGYKIGDEKPTRLFSWISCDVNGQRVNVLDVSDDGVVTGILTDYDTKNQTYSSEFVHISKVPYDSVPHKEPITLAVLYLDYNVQDLIIDYNRRSDKYRIEVIDYSEYNNDQDGWDAGLTKLNTEILSGNVPDILSLNGLNYTQLASKGILADLYPFIDADKELKREDFFPNVLAALEVNGKLCSTVSSFYISSAIGAASVVGDEPGWTYDEFNEALASMPEGCTAFDQYVTRDEILNTCLALDMNEYVDWNTGKVRFDSPEFIQLLKFANSFPSEFDWENFDWSKEESTEDRLAQGKQMLVRTSAYSIEDIFYNNYTQFLGGKVTYIGFPTAHGTGNMISFAGDSGYAMSAKGAHQDAAWEFLRSFLTEKYQSENVYALPSRTDVFEAKAKEATTIQYERNDEGKELLDDNGEKIPVVRYNMWNRETNEIEEIYALTEEQVDQIRQLILTTTKVADYNQEILNIVSEQAAPFFAGQKTAEEVAKLVQSKANIYVNEQR